MSRVGRPPGTAKLSEADTEAADYAWRRRIHACLVIEPLSNRCASLAARGFERKSALVSPDTSAESVARVEARTLVTVYPRIRDLLHLSPVVVAAVRTIASR